MFDSDVGTGDFLLMLKILRVFGHALPPRCDPSCPWGAWTVIQSFNIGFVFLLQYLNAITKGKSVWHFPFTFNTLQDVFGV